MPNDGLGPMTIVPDSSPASTRSATPRAVAMGTANADASLMPDALEPAVVMPSTSPSSSNSGPPESPGSAWASVSRRPERVSSGSSGAAPRTRMLRSRPTMLPEKAVR